MAKASDGEDSVVAIDGHRLKLTNLDKVLYPQTGTTKAQVIDYYARIAPVMIPHVSNRPVTRKRWVQGVGTAGEPGEVFFQKNLDQGTPAWVRRRTIEHRSGPNEYPIANDLATLVWLAQMAALELHVPQWQFGRTGLRRNPDRMVLDLDPGPGAGLPECAEVARLARSILLDMGLDPMPVTSGSKGIHLYAALEGTLTSEEVSAVAHELARAMEADHPELVVSDMKRSLRAGKVLVDWSQNNANKTTIAPYSLRGRPHPTVAAPRTWRELESPQLGQLELAEVLRRVERDGDPLARIAGAPRTPDRLAKYRSMRDGSKTPEPVPDEAPAPSGGGDPIFVIQEHHARRLHWDFRLEHDGVLVSWALPRGVPTDPTRNHLAVQTEDHPIEYGSFAGSIPHGEYGAGEVTIWDAGTYELEKWRDGEEVIAVLHGQQHGTRKYALIRTGGRGGDQPNNWLIHLMPGDQVHEYGPDWRRAPAKGRPTIGRRGGAKPPSPMLAVSTAAGLLEDPDEWAYEMKWDGIRAIAEITQGELRLLSRNGIDITQRYPELDVLADVVDASSAVLDGEIVALNARGRPDFGRLQSRMGLTRPGEIERAMVATPVRFIAFDLLRLDDEDLMPLPYEDRRDRLARALTPRGPVQLPPVFEGDLAAALRTSRELGLEGVLAKRRDSAYSPGRRSRAWAKLKHARTQEVVIGGWKPGNGTRAHRVGSLLMGVPEGDRLRFVGKVGTGFTERQLDEITRTLAALERTSSPFDELPTPERRDARFVTPKLVGEVEFTEWTPGGRLRAPVWRGWRPDKRAPDVVVEP